MTCQLNPSLSLCLIDYCVGNMSAPFLDAPVPKGDARTASDGYDLQRVEVSGPEAYLVAFEQGRQSYLKSLPGLRRVCGGHLNMTDQQVAGQRSSALLGNDSGAAAQRGEEGSRVNIKL